MPNGLVPQAPVHTDSLTVYETHLDVIKTQEGEKEIRKPRVEATAVVEQRVSHFIMGMGLWGTMTGPLLVVLHTMPAAVFAGVFFVVGVSLRYTSHLHSKLTWGSGALLKATALSKSSSSSNRSIASFRQTTRSPVFPVVRSHFTFCYRLPVWRLQWQSPKPSPPLVSQC